MTYTKSDLEEIIAPLGENPAAEISRLQQTGAELAGLKALLSEMMQRGLSSVLYELPESNGEQVLHWGWLSNNQLRDDRSEFSVPEKMRRSFLALQKYNLGVEPSLKLYAEKSVLSAVGEVNASAAEKWLMSHQSEIDFFNDTLRGQLDETDDRHRHNAMALEYSASKNYADLLQWPARYDALAA